MLQADRTAALKLGAIARALETDAATPATRRAIEARLAGPGEEAPRCFDAQGFATLTAVCDRLVPQGKDDRCIDLARRLDARLAEGVGDGWRYDALPSDREAMARGIKGVDETALALFSAPFASLTPGHQDTVLGAVQDGSATSGEWDRLPPKRLFEELLAALTELYYSHPYAQEEIGYIGMADAYGFHALGLNARDPIEDEASLAPL